MINCYGYNGYRMGNLTLEHMNTLEEAKRIVLERLCSLPDGVANCDNDIPQGYTLSIDGKPYCARMYTIPSDEMPYSPSSGWILKVHNCKTHKVVEYRRL